MKTNELIMLVMLLLGATALASCLDNEDVDKVEEITLYVSAETGITYHWGDDYRTNPIECMLVRYDNSATDWETMDFGEIVGFTYEKGCEYKLKVQRTTLANPPADASCYTWKLIEILSSTRVADISA